MDRHVCIASHLLLIFIVVALDRVYILLGLGLGNQSILSYIDSLYRLCRVVDLGV